MLERLPTHACSLGERERSDRAKRLLALAARASSADEPADAERLSFPPDPELAAELAEVAALETQCCPVAFTLTIERDALVVETRSVTS